MTCDSKKELFIGLLQKEVGSASTDLYDLYDDLDWKNVKLTRYRRIDASSMAFIRNICYGEVCSDEIYDKAISYLKARTKFHYIRDNEERKKQRELEREKIRRRRMRG